MTDIVPAVSTNATQFSPELRTCNAAAIPLIDVYFVSFATLKESYRNCYFLSPAEREQASSILAPAAAENYRLTRSFLRSVLAYQTNWAPDDINLTRLAQGKPVMIGGPCFNLSHTTECLVLALAKSGDELELGVDVEHRVSHADYLCVARRIFTRRELEQLQSYGAGFERRKAFTRGWTRKEAVIKAIGCGFLAPTEQFDVSLAVPEDVNQSLLLDSGLSQLSMQHCKLFDLGTRYNSELSLAIIGDTGRYLVQQYDLDKSSVEDLLSSVADQHA